MGMSRKHYQEMAELFAGERALCDTFDNLVYREGRLKQLQDIVRSMADICKRDNPRFDRDKFYVACGFGEMAGTDG